jgi:hypothetical protein
MQKERGGEGRKDKRERMPRSEEVRDVVTLERGQQDDADERKHEGQNQMGTVRRELES